MVKRHILVLLAALGLMVYGPGAHSWFTRKLCVLQRVAADYYAGSAGNVTVDGGCSGLDIMGLLVVVVMIYPASWRARAIGGLGGIALVLAVNTARIAHLGHVGAAFETLHHWVWPGVLMLTVSGYVLSWMLYLGGKGAKAAFDSDRGRRARGVQRLDTHRPGNDYAYGDLDADG